MLPQYGALRQEPDLYGRLSNLGARFKAREIKCHASRRARKIRLNKRISDMTIKADKL
jgi:hypothetical protein